MACAGLTDQFFQLFRIRHVHLRAFRPASLAATRRAESESMSATTTKLRARASSSQRARPIPDAPPVTIATGKSSFSIAESGEDDCARPGVSGCIDPHSVESG